VWETVAWHRYGNGPASEIARAIAGNWACHTLDGLPLILILGGGGTLVLIASRRRFDGWVAQSAAVAIAFAILAIPAVLLTIIWTTTYLPCTTTTV
jgi:hypothetical protein